MSLLYVVEEAEKKTQSSIGVSAEAGIGLCLPLTSELKSLFEDASVPKRVHDLKLAMHVLCGLEVDLKGKVDDAMLLSYALNPTHTTQTLADVAARHNQPAPGSLPSAAATTQVLVTDLRMEAERCNVAKVYEDIDLPLAPVLYRMEKKGVRIDTGVLDHLSIRFGQEMERVGERIYSLAGRRFNINSPKQLGEVLFKEMGLPIPVKYGKGKTISTAVEVLEGLAETNEVPRLVLEFRHLSKLKSTYVDSLPLLSRR